MRRRWIAAIVGIAVAIALFLWLRHGDGAATPSAPVLHVVLSAQPSSLQDGESSALALGVTEDGRAVDAKACTITWTSDGGNASGQDFVGVFTPSAPGLARVTATVQVGGLLASATVQILVVAS